MVNFELLRVKLAEANEQFKDAQPTHAPYVSQHVTSGIGFYTEAERRVMRKANRERDFAHVLHECYAGSSTAEDMPIPPRNERRMSRTPRPSRGK